MAIGQAISQLRGASGTRWSRKIGRFHSRNNIVVVDGRAVFGNSGREWQQADEQDGVYCVGLDDGREAWFCPTGADVNQIAVFGDIVAAGTDDGDFIIVDLQTGFLLEVWHGHSPIYARPFSLTVLGARRIVAVTGAGEIIGFDPVAKAFATLGQVPGNVRANALQLGRPFEEGAFLVGTEDGQIWKVRIGDAAECKPFFKINAGRNAQYDVELNIRGISALVRSEDRLIVTFARDTYSEQPPLMAISLTSGQPVWAARLPKSLSRQRQTVGNARIQPVVWRNLVLCTFSYDDALHAFSLANGRSEWKIRLDDGFFQNWSSPVLDGDSLYVARVNGIVHKVDLQRRKIAWSNSVETPSPKAIGLSSSDEAPWPIWKPRGYDLPGPVPGQALVGGIAATPTVADGFLMVGTISGSLYCIKA